MGLSIVIDTTRSRVLMRVGKKHRSQALEADALHFSTDILSSSVVIAGLVAVYIGERIKGSNPGLAGLVFRADAFAALGVSVIIVYVRWESGPGGRWARSWTTPRAAWTPASSRPWPSLPGVLAVDRVRARESGPTSFVDVTLAVARTASLEEAHAIATRAEDRVREPGAARRRHGARGPGGPRRQEPAGAHL